MNYMDNLHQSIIKANNQASRYGDAKAWDNKKKKTLRRYRPRGKVIVRLVGLERMALRDMMLTGSYG